MKMRLFVAVAAVACAAMLASARPAPAEDRADDRALAAKAPAAVCPTPSAVLPSGPAPVPVQGCNFCTGEDFCPESGVRCSYLGTCERGANRCCDYECQCDPTCTTISEPNQVCPYQLPGNCNETECPRGTLCQVSYCGAEGIRCVHDNTCGPGGCCNYACGPDPTCTLPDPLPPNAC